MNKKITPEHQAILTRRRKFYNEAVRMGLSHELACVYMGVRMDGQEWKPEDYEWLVVARTQGILYGGQIQPMVMSREKYRQIPDWRVGEYEVLENGLPSKSAAEVALLSAPTTR